MDDFGVKRVTGVRTPFGTTSTSRVVNCTGVWAPKIGAMVGTEVPLLGLKHSYALTESIPDVKNMPNVRDHDLSLYFRVQGDNIALGGYENNPVYIDKVIKQLI